MSRAYSAREPAARGFRSLNFSKSLTVRSCQDQVEELMTIYYSDVSVPYYDVECVDGTTIYMVCTSLTIYNQNSLKLSSCNPSRFLQQSSI